MPDNGLMSLATNRFLAYIQPKNRMISFRTAYPKKIGHLVKSFWYLEVTPGDSSNGNKRYYEEEVVPDGHHELIFHTGARPARVRLANASGWMEEPYAVVAGQIMQQHQLQLETGARLYGIRFFPHTLPAFLPIPVAELTDRICDLGAACDPRPFWNCITDNPDTTFANFETLLIRRLRSTAVGNAGYDYVNAAVQAIMSNKGQVTGAQLTRRTGISKTHLDNLFLKYVGTTPKSFSRIIQLNSFIVYRSRHPEMSLTQCGYEAGYFDQSHLAKAFASFTGSSPGEYFRRQNEISGIFSTL